MKRRKVTGENNRLVENLVTVIRNSKPILKDPQGLTDNIMNAIRENPAQSKPDTSNDLRKSQAFIVLRRLLAAASVCLLLVFGYEEYVLVQKISKLEKQSSSISRSSQYEAALNLKKAINILTINPQMINQYPGFKSKKIDIRTIFKAAMFAEAGGFSPDDIKLLIRGGYNPPDQAFITFIHNFDSTHHTIQR